MRRCARLALVLVPPLVLAPLGAGTGAQGPSALPAARANTTTPIPFVEARPILERLRTSLPSELATKTTAELESAWPGWVARRNVEIRARVERGDEDSLVNLLLFGTSFTRLPRALNDSARLGGPQRAAEIVRGRIEDMIDGISSPGGNERLLFARELAARQGIDPATASGKDQLRALPARHHETRSSATSRATSARSNPRRRRPTPPPSSSRDRRCFGRADSPPIRPSGRISLSTRRSTRSPRRVCSAPRRCSGSR